jgi:hypothetical protein
MAVKSIPVDSGTLGKVFPNIYLVIPLHDAKAPTLSRVGRVLNATGTLTMRILQEFHILERVS